MSRSLLVLFVVLVAGGALAWWLLGQGDGAGPDGRFDRAGVGADPLDLEGGDDAGRSARTRDPNAPPVLFGRPREKRPGKGAVTGVVADAHTGQPVEEAKLTFMGKAFDDTDVLERIVSDEMGRFSVGGVSAGEGYRLRVVAKGLPERTLTTIEVQDGRTTTLGKIWLGRATTLTGRVVDPLGRGVSGADVQVHAGGTNWAEMMGNMVELFEQLDQEPEPLARTQTDRNGTYEFETIDPGAYTVIARAAGFGQGMRDAVVTSSAPPEVEIRLVPARRLTGIVLEGRDRALPGARIAVLAGNDPLAFLYGRSFTESGPDGRFAIEIPSGGQQLTVMATAAGFPTYMERVPAGSDEVRVVFERGCNLTVELLAMPDDEPVEGASIVLAVSDATTFGQQEPGAVANGRTDAQGRVRLVVPPGRIQMAFVSHPVLGGGMWLPQMSRIPGAMQGPSDPLLEEGESAITLRLPVRRVLVGTVTGPDGEAVVGARVSSPLSVQLGGSPVITDASGAYRVHLPEFPGGGIVVMVTAEGYVQDDGTLNATGAKPDANGEIRHDVEMNASALVTGRVVGPTKKPLAGVRVRYRASRMDAMMGTFLGAGGETLTGADGTYVLDGLRPGGSASVVARKDGFIDSASGKFEVKAGEVAEAPDVVLSRGARIVVAVQDPGGRALADARVEFTFDRKDEVIWDFMEAFRGNQAVATDSGGRATVDHVPPGSVTLTANHEDHASAKATTDAPTGDGEEKLVTLRLRAARTIEGRVLDQEGNPVVGALVTVSVEAAASDGAGPAGEPETVGVTHSRSDGRFSLSRVPAGQAQVHVSARGLQSVSLGAEDVREIRMQPVDLDRDTRIEELTQLIGTKQLAIMEAGNDAERRALQQEVLQLSQELGDLQAEAEAAEGAGDR